MAQEYRDYSLAQEYLLPQRPRDWLPEGHLALFLEDRVSQLDLGAITSRYRRGRGPRAAGLPPPNAADAAALRLLSWGLQFPEDGGGL